MMSKKSNGNKDDTKDVNSLELLDLAIQRYEAETASRFVCIKKEKLFGKENEIDISSLKSVNIRFQDTQTNTCPFIKYDGVPFVIIGKKIWECHQGKDRDIKKKVQARLRKDLFSKSDHNFCKIRGTLSRESKKKSCPARIFARHVIKFPEFKFGKKPSQSRESISNAIKKILKNGDALSYQHKYYVSFASANNHQYHFKEREPVTSTRIDAQLASFIETMVHFHGVSSCRTIQPLLEVFLREIMFPGKPLPPKSNKKFWPSSNDISSYMALAVMKQGVTNSNRVEEVSKMSRWAKLQQSNALFTQIQQIYSNTFPLEVRHFLSEWIEEQPWFEVQEDDPSHKQYAQQLLTQLLNIVEAKAVSCTGDLLIMKFKLQEAILILRNLYENNAMGLVQVMKQCLKQEEDLIQHVEGNVQNMTVDQSTHDQTGYLITMDLEKLAGKTAKSDSDLKKLQEKQESFIIQYQDNLKINDQMRQLNQQHQQNQVNNTEEFTKKKKQLTQQKENLEIELTQKAHQLLQLRIKLAEFFVETVKDLQEVQKKVLDDELIRWKRGQQLAGNGAPFDSSFKLLQQWCETLAEIIWSNRQQIKGVLLLRVTLPIDLPPRQVDHLPDLLETITSLLSSLVTSTFIVETQPPQVMKKDSRFTASVRLLVGGKLNVHMNPPQVKATIISENQAKNLLQTDVKAKNETSGEILNNVGTMEYQQTTGQLSINFRNMQLKRIKRSDRKGTDAVTEEKFCILFQSDFSIGGNELVFQVWSLSLPVVVTVHGNQESNALATVLWDNAFSEHGRVPFQVPESVPWPKLAEQLNIKFQSGTGRGLSDDNIQYLASKIFNGPIGDDYNSRLVSWSQFNKDALPARNFSFWEWFYAMYKLTMQHLKEQWNDGSILGFVSKAKAQEWLLARPNGTFLLRFSDSEIGGITIAWVQAETGVWNLAPFVAKDFVIRSLSDRIKDLSNLVWLYPDVPKDSAFSKYYTLTIDQPHQSADGYIKPHLVNVINWSTDNPQTPQIMNPMSPSNSLYDASSPVSSWNDAQLPMNLADNFEMDEITMMQSNTDYNPDDIDSINVNELLTNCYPNHTGV